MTDVDVPTHLVIPFLSLTADNCRVLAGRSEEVIPLLGQGKSGRMLKSRFTAALKRLNAIADRGSYKQKRIIVELFNALTKDCEGEKPQLFPRSWWSDIDRAKSAKNEHVVKRLVANYLSGMSDVYCMQMYALL